MYSKELNLSWLVERRVAKQHFPHKTRHQMELKFMMAATIDYSIFIWDGKAFHLTRKVFVRQGKGWDKGCLAAASTKRLCRRRDESIE